MRRRIDARRGRRLLVLMYHDILADGVRGVAGVLDDDSPTATEFAAHLETVSRSFRMVTLADATREIEDGGLSEDSVAITFDDGYAAVHHTALPLLHRYGVPATLFVLTGWIDGMTFWWHRLRGIIAAAPAARLSGDRIGAIVAAEIPNRDGVSDRRRRAALARAVEDTLRDRPDGERDAAIDRLRSELLDGESAVDGNRPLNWAQIEELSRNGIELAAHTHSHINLRYADTDAVSAELEQSRDIIARHTDRPVVGFAYPYGKDVDHYARFESLLRDHGFRYACTASPGNNREADLLSLRRVAPPSTRSRALIDHALCGAFVRDAAFYDMRVSR